MDKKWKEYINSMFKEYQFEYKNVTPYAYLWAYSDKELKELKEYLNERKDTFIKVEKEEIIDDNVYKIYVEREKW